jgi:hypothetical protein
MYIFGHFFIKSYFDNRMSKNRFLTILKISISIGEVSYGL